MNPKALELQARTQRFATDVIRFCESLPKDTATQKIDPQGAIFDGSGYVAVSGTSFSAPIVAGAAAILKAAPSHTRSRLNLDLTRTYVSGGKSFQLIDLFETDQLALLRSQASRVSGETALMRHGIPASTGLKILRDATAFGCTFVRRSTARRAHG